MSLDFVRGHKILTREEEIHLARQIAKGGRRGKSAREQMMLCNLRMVAKLANVTARTRGLHNLSVEDLFQAGTIGLHRAVEKWDPTRGYKFSTYAYWWIRQAINREIDVYDPTIRMTQVPRQMLHKAFSWMKANERKHGTLRQAAEAMGVDYDELMHYVVLHGGTRSLDAALADTDDTFIPAIDDGQSPEEYAERCEMIDRVRMALELLPDEEAAVVRATYGIGMEQPMSQREYVKAGHATTHYAQARHRAGMEKLRSILEPAMLCESG
jgi:RNA polymerase sigma factor (sigma-70 family)